MTTVEQVETAAAVSQQTRARTKRRRPIWRGMWWRHVVALIAVLWSRSSRSRT